MKKILGGLVFSAFLAAPAMAADMPVKAPPPAPSPPAYNWSGFYIGGHAGAAWGKKDWFDLGVIDGGALGSHDVTGFLAGGQIGINWQAPGSNWVLGIEADGSWTDADGRHNIDVITFATRINWFATVTGRIGYAWDRLLLYAKGGVAFADEEHDVNFFVDLLPVLSTGDKNRTGWTVGAGAEIALAGNWSAKLEYNYMDFGEKDVNFTNQFGEPVGSVRIDQQIHVFKFGVNYRFGWGGGPVVARY